MKLEKLKISDINPSEYNPRTITKEEFEGLFNSIKLFGQVENLIVNKDMTLISGHQRLEAMRRLGYEEVDCYIVDLPKDQEMMLNLEMNNQKVQGKFDDIKLAEILEKVKLDTNYRKLRLDKLEPLDLSEEDDDPEFIYSKELKESHNYIVLYFDNDIDWQTAEELFELQSVHDLFSRPGYVKKGIGRVLNGSEAIKKIRDKGI